MVPSIIFNKYRHLELSKTLENSVCYSYTSYEMTNFYDFRFKRTATAGIGIHPIKPDFHSWCISKIQSGCEDTLEERYAIKFCFKLRKKCHRNVWSASDWFSTILHESSIIFSVA